LQNREAHGFIAAVDLLERETSLADLESWSGDLARGGCVVLIGAEAGLGKTALVRAFTDGKKGVRVLWGACDALFTPRPLAPLLDIARQTEGPLREAAARHVERDALFAAALDELESRPTVVVFEDLHWADEATLDFLKFVGRRIARTRAMLIATYRDDEVQAGHPLYQVLADLPRAHTQRVALIPLSPAAVAKLAKRHGRSPRDVHRITAGNPLFVTEVLASEESAIPGSIREAVLARAARLTPGARRVAELVAIVPAAAESWLIEAVVAPTVADVDGCLAMGMQRRDDGALAYRHELVRRAVEASLPPAHLRQLHASALRALQARTDTAPARLAHHASGAEDSAAVIELARAAALQAAGVGAHREAASHYAAALAHAANLPLAEQAELQERLAYEYYLTDRSDLALEARRAALVLWQTLGDTLRQGDSLRWLSRMTWFVGRRADADRYAAEAIATLEPLPPGRELALAYSNRAQLEMLAHRSADAVAWATRALELAERLGDVEAQVHALNNRGTAKLLEAHYEGENDLSRSLQMALQSNLHEHAARAYTNLSSTCVSLRLYAEAARYLEQGLAYTERLDLDSWRLYMQAWRARSRLEQGDWLGAGDDAEAVLANRRTSPVARLPALVALGHLRIRRGDPDAATPLAEADSLASQARELQRTAPLLAALADGALAKGDLSQLVPRLQDAAELAQTQADPWIRGSLEIWLWRAGARTSVSEGCAQPYRLEAGGRWQEAAAAWQQLGCPYERACMLGWYGDETAQREALAIFESLGAEPAAQELRRRMRAAGARGVPRGSRTSTRNNAFGLTRREAQVLELMRAGLRNSAIAKRLYLSTRTIDHHVSAVLAKLGATTRAEAIALTAAATEAEPE
jgi:DNA-binding CsgD family transcriptional regulator